MVIELPVAATIDCRVTIGERQSSVFLVVSLVVLALVIVSGNSVS